MINDLLKTAGPLLADNRVLGAIVSGFCLWAVFSAIRLGVATRRLRRTFRRATIALGVDSDPVAFASRFEAAAINLQSIPMIRAGWRDFREGLIVPTQPGRPVLATTSIRHAFDLSGLLRANGADPRYHAALPGMLVGAGLLFTFLGLAAALASAGDVVAEGITQEARNSALRGLLDAASVKFITSLVGLALSISYAIFRKTTLRLVEESLRAFFAAVEERIPFRSAASLLAEGNATLEKQYGDVQRIGNEFFVNLGSTLEREFGSGLEQHIGPLATAIEKLSDRLAVQSEDAMGVMLQRFLERLEGAVGESMRSTAGTLDTLGERLDGLQGAMSAAAGRMASAADEMATGMGRGTQSALGEITGQIGTLVASLRDAASEARESGRVAGDEMTRRMAETADVLSAAVAGFQHRIEQGAAAGVDRLSAPLDGMAGHVRAMQDVAGALTEQVRAMTTALSHGTPSLAMAAQDLRSAAGLVHEGLTPLRAVADSLRGSTEGLIGATAALDASQRGSIELSTSLRSASDRFGELDTSMAQTFLRLRDGLDQYQRAIQEFVGGMDQHLAKSVSGLQAVASSLDDTVQDLVERIPVRSR